MSDQVVRPNPYVGPRAFHTGERIFGRDYEIHELLNLLVAQRIVLLHSPSGAGKSSLVQAGLVPRLREEGFAVLPSMRVNGLLPEFAVPSGFNRYVYSALLNLEERLPLPERRAPEDLACMSLAQYLREEVAANRILPAARVLDEAEPDAEPADAQPNLVLIFDQFEEILTVDPNAVEAKRAFFAQLGEMLRDRSIWALFSMREDFLGGLTPYLRPVPTQLAHTYRLGFLDAESAMQAIIEPAALFGVEFERAAAQSLVDNLRRVKVRQPDGTVTTEPGPEVEPLQLQVISYRLWESISPDDTSIDQADVDRMGDVNRSLAEYYDLQVSEAAQAGGMRERAVRAWVQDHLITSGGLRGQVLMGAESSEGLPNPVIRRLVNAYLLRSEVRGGGVWFELAHDRLVQPVLESNQAWFDANLSLLQKQAALWDAQGRIDGLLIAGPDLQGIRAWAAEHPDEMSAVDRRFLDACEQSAQRVEQERRLAETTRKVEEKARAAKRLTAFVAVLLVALAVMVFLLVYALFQTQRANQQAQVANEQSNTATVALGALGEQQSTIVSALDQANVEKENALSSLMTATAALNQAEQEKAIADVKRGEVAAQATQSSVLSATQQAAYLNGQATQQVMQYILSQPTPSPTSPSPAAGYESDRLAQAAVVAPQTELALLLALQAENGAATALSRQALYAALQNSLVAQRQSLGAVIDTSGPVRSLAFSPKDGLRLAVSTGQGLLLWDMTQTLENQASASPPGLVDRSSFPSGALERAFFDPTGRLAVLLKISPGKAPPSGQTAWIEGIDVNRAAGQVDWSLVAGEMTFAYARATQGTRFLDPSFAGNWFGMKEVSLPRGAIHYFQFQEDPAEQASFFLDSVPSEPGDLPPALDLSDVQKVVTFQRPEEITQRAKTWLDAVEKATGRIPVLIVNPSSPAFDVFLTGAEFQRYPLWIMSFSRPDPQQVFANRRWLYWLYADDFSPPGVPAKVSLLRFNGSLVDLLALSYEGMVQEALTGKVLFPIGGRFDESAAAGSTLALRSAEDGTLQIFSLDTYQALIQPEPFSFPGKEARLAVNSAGSTVAVSAGQGVALLSLGGWGTTPVSDTPARALAFSPNYTRLAAATPQNTVLLLPLSQVTLSAYSQLPPVKQIGPVDSPALPAGVTALAFSSDSGLVAAGLADGRVALIETERGQVLGIYPLPTGAAVTALAFHPSQPLLSVGTGGGTVLIDLRAQPLANLACALAGRSLSLEERRQYEIGENAPVLCR